MNFEDILENEVKQALERVAEDELESNSEEYFLGMTDSGCYNNGVGFVTINPEPEYDEDKAYEVAKETITDSIRDDPDCDFLYNLFCDNEKIRWAFAEWIEKNF